MYSSALSLASAVDGGGWSTPCPGHFTPGKETRIQFLDFQPIVSHYTVCTISAHSLGSILTMLFRLPSHLYVLTVQRCWYTVASPIQ